MENNKYYNLKLEELWEAKISIEKLLTKIASIRDNKSVGSFIQDETYNYKKAIVNLREWMNIFRQFSQCKINEIYSDKEKNNDFLKFIKILYDFLIKEKDICFQLLNSELLQDKEGRSYTNILQAYKDIRKLIETLVLDWIKNISKENPNEKALIKQELINKIRTLDFEDFNNKKEDEQAIYRNYILKEMEEQKNERRERIKF